MRWQGNQIDLVLMNWREYNCQVKYYWILADSKEVAENFFSAVCEWNSQIRNEVLVFEHGYWSKNPELFKSIKTANFDNLILGGDAQTRHSKRLNQLFCLPRNLRNLRHTLKAWHFINWFTR